MPGAFYEDWRRPCCNLACAGTWLWQSRDGVCTHAPLTRAHVEVERRGEFMTLGSQLVLLFVLPIPIACITWTVTHEDLFREPRDWCAAKGKSARSLYSRKFFYVFTCEYCFSHYVTAFFLFITRYTLVFDDWRGYLIAGFSLVWLANIYMSFFGRMRLEIREDRLAVDAGEERAEVADAQNDPGKPR